MSHMNYKQRCGKSSKIYVMQLSAKLQIVATNCDTHGEPFKTQ